MFYRNAMRTTSGETCLTFSSHVCNSVAANCFRLMHTHFWHLKKTKKQQQTTHKKQQPHNCSTVWHTVHPAEKATGVRTTYLWCVENCSDIDIFEVLGQVQFVCIKVLCHEAASVSVQKVKDKKHQLFDSYQLSVTFLYNFQVIYN